MTIDFKRFRPNELSKQTQENGYCECGRGQWENSYKKPQQSLTVQQKCIHNLKKNFGFC